MFVRNYASDPILPIDVKLSYDTRDPFAIKASFFRNTEEEVDWLFSRELLAQGLLAPAGQADVHIRPNDEDLTLMRIELVSPDGAAMFAVSREELSNFLECTYDIIPLGAESLWIDFDFEIHRLVSG